MTTKKTILRIGIIGCGTIGSGIARSIKKDLAHTCRLSGLFDILPEKTTQLAKDLRSPKIVKNTLLQLIKSSDLVVEAVADKNTNDIVKQVLTLKKNILVMSVGKILNEKNLFHLASKNNCNILVPSGAIAGLDAVKAASLAGIKKITLTTRKPPSGLKGSPYLEKKGIKISRIKKETVIFKGNVSQAVSAFPKNINVAAALALASNSASKLIVRIVTSPKFKTNSHEIEVVGNFGKLTARTENVPSPDNPKTSYLAILSGIQTLKQFAEKIFIGT